MRLMRRLMVLIAVSMAAILARATGGGTRTDSRTVLAPVGEPVDLVPWTYVWRADRIYRTAREALPSDQLKSIYYDTPDMLKRFQPPPKGRLRVGFLWTGALSYYHGELRWPAGSVPSPESVDVRVYPTSFGWFGWTVDQVLDKPTSSPYGRTWTYFRSRTWT